MSSRGAAGANSPPADIDKKVPWVFFINQFSQAFGIQTSLTYLNVFMTNYMLYTPLAVAGILTIGRTVDTCVSLVAGAIVQKANFKTGPYRTWILMNGPLLLIGNFMIFFNPDLTPQLKLVFFLIGHFFRNIPQNFLVAAQNTLIGKAAGPNFNNRLAITAKTSLAGSTSGLCVSAIMIASVEYFNNSLGNGRGYLVTACWMSVFQCIGQLITYIVLGPYDKYDPNLKRVEGSSVQVKVAHSYKDTFTNRYVWVLMIRAIIAGIGPAGSIGTYMFMYSLGGAANMAISRTATNFLGLAVVSLSPPIARKLGVKRSVMISSTMALINNVIMFLFVHGNFPLYLTCVLINRIAMGPSSVYGINQWINASDYQMHKTGRDSRPLIMSINSITLKVGQFGSSFTYAWVMWYCNFVQHGPGNVTLDAERLVKANYGYAMISGAISLLIYIIGWNKSDAEFAAMAESNRVLMAEREAAAKAAAEAEAGGSTPAAAGGGGGGAPGGGGAAGGGGS